MGEKRGGVYEEGEEAGLYEHPGGVAEGDGEAADEERGYVVGSGVGEDVVSLEVMRAPSLAVGEVSNTVEALSCKARCERRYVCFCISELFLLPSPRTR